MGHLHPGFVPGTIIVQLMFLILVYLESGSFASWFCAWHYYTTTNVCVFGLSRKSHLHPGFVPGTIITNI